jgi:hypothetical protein
MRVIELLRIASSYRRRLARIETTLAQSNKLLEDSKVKEQPMEHKTQNGPDFIKNCQLQEELLATIAESKDAV